MSLADLADLFRPDHLGATAQAGVCGHPPGWRSASGPGEMRPAGCAAAESAYQGVDSGGTCS